MNPLASIICITYNHEKFIAQAIKSFINQKTNFKYEIIVADDASSDKSQDIINHYYLKYPYLIKPIYRNVNIGMSKNWVDAYKLCSGKYISICEGDDYWTDPYKLQKQVDFLETNEEYGLVCTDIDVVDENNNIFEWDSLKAMRNRYSSGYIFFEQLYGATINTLTVCFRKELITELYSKKDIWYIGDWWLWLRISMKSKVKYFDTITAHYRRHPTNATTKEKIATSYNKKKLYYILYDNIIYFDSYNKMSISDHELKKLFHSIIRLLIRSEGTLKMKIKILPLLIKYFPGTYIFFRMISRWILKKLIKFP